MPKFTRNSSGALLQITTDGEAAVAEFFGADVFDKMNPKAVVFADQDTGSVIDISMDDDRWEGVIAGLVLSGAKIPAILVYRKLMGITSLAEEKAAVEKIAEKFSARLRSSPGRLMTADEIVADAKLFYDGTSKIERIKAIRQTKYTEAFRALGYEVYEPDGADARIGLGDAKHFVELWWK